MSISNSVTINLQNDGALQITGIHVCRSKLSPISPPTLIAIGEFLSCVKYCIEDMATFTILAKVFPPSFSSIQKLAKFHVYGNDYNSAGKSSRASKTINCECLRKVLMTFTRPRAQGNFTKLC